MRAYIKSTSAISPQQTFDRAHYLNDWIPQHGQYFNAAEPVYKGFIDPKLLRRMSRIIKMGVAAAKDVLVQAKLDQPEAVLVGTGLGCMDDTEKFLKNIILSEEGILSPTAFIQSTHNTVAGQIALLLKCQQYNFTYTNRGHSFENALIDGCMLLAEGKDNILIGAAEEATQVGFNAMHEIGCVGDNEKHDGPALGEGASFFVLTKDAVVGTPYLQDIKTARQLTKRELQDVFQQFFKRNNIDPSHIDALILGRNDEPDDPFYETVQQVFDKNIPVVAFKKISGEHFTASGFGMHLATKMLQQQRIFQNTMVSGTFSRPLKNVLIYNHYKKVNHTLMLLSVE